MQRRATYGWKENEAASTGRNKQRYPQANSARKHPAAATVMLLMLTYDISFDDSVPGSPHHPETILYARVIASGRQCP